MTSTVPAVDAGFLSAAADAGLLDHLAGWCYVADEYVDEVSSERQCLVEYCEPALLDDSRALSALLDRLRVRFGATETVIVRVSGGRRLDRPWIQHLTCVRYAGEPNPAVDPLGGVVPAGEHHRPQLAEWLVRAFLAAGVEQRRAVSADIAAATAEALLDQANRHSYVYIADGTPVGHVTVLDDCRDDLTGRVFVELLDVLVEPVEDQARVRRLLVAAAVEHARARRLPLIGTVVHPAGDDGTGRGAKIVQSLMRSNWVVDHVYWKRLFQEVTP